jgi:hypothetical protein
MRSSSISDVYRRHQIDNSALRRLFSGGKNVLSSPGVPIEGRQGDLAAFYRWLASKCND